MVIMLTVNIVYEEKLVWKSPADSSSDPLGQSWIMSTENPVMGEEVRISLGSEHS